MACGNAQPVFRKIFPGAHVYGIVYHAAKLIIGLEHHISGTLLCFHPEVRGVLFEDMDFIRIEG